MKVSAVWEKRAAGKEKILQRTMLVEKGCGGATPVVLAQRRRENSEKKGERVGVLCIDLAGGLSVQGVKKGEELNLERLFFALSGLLRGRATEISLILFTRKQKKRYQ